MAMGTILSNMGAGISGAATRMANSEGGKMAFGDTKYFQNAYENAVKEKGVMNSAKGVGKMFLDHATAADYAGQGGKRAAAVASRAGVGLAGNFIVGGAVNHGLNRGGWTQDQNGNRDIAGIPFI